MTALLRKLETHAAVFSNKTALTNGYANMSYTQLYAAITDKATLLQKQNAAVVGLQLDNGADWVIWDLAMVMADVVCVPLPAFFTQGQLQHVMHTVGMDHIVTTEGLSPLVCPSKALPKGTSKITFTSGTTGTPKGVCLLQDRLEDLAVTLVDAIGPEYASKHFSALPLSILLENVAGIYATLMAGATCHVASLAQIGFINPFAPDFKMLLQGLAATQATSVIMVPQLLRGLMAQMMAEKTKLPHLKFLAVGGAHVPPALLEAAHMMGLPVYEGYGLSECGSVVALNTPRAHKNGTSGRILPHVQWAMDGQELVIKNPAFLGYVDASHEGPFHTGDVCDVRDGFVKIHGRSKNVLITAFGRNVSPEWVESVLLSRPDIAQALVYGDGQEQLSALIVSSASMIDIRAAIDATNAELPVYAHVGHIDVVPPFTAMDGTATPDGRLKRAAIFKKHDQLIQKQTEDYHDLLRSARA